MPRFKHSAVDRNRLKRRLRELARLRLLPALADAPSADLVVRVAPQAYAASFEALAADVERAVRQLGRGPLPARRPDPPRAARRGRGATPSPAAPGEPAAADPIADPIADPPSGPTPADPA